MLSGEGNAGERWKTTIGLVSKKATLHVQNTFLYFSFPFSRFSSNKKCLLCFLPRLASLAYRLLSLFLCLSLALYSKFVDMTIAHFRVRYDRWIKEEKTYFFTALASIWSNIFTNSNEKKTCLLLCLLSIFNFQTLTWQNFWIFYFTSRLTLYECVVNVCIQRWFVIRNWTINLLSFIL